MRRNAVSGATAGGLFTVGILIGAAGLYAAHIETATLRQTTTQTVTVSIVGCGSAIRVNTTLDSDVGPCSEDGILIRASHTVLDCAGHAITAAPMYQSGYSGISVAGVSNVTVKNCRVNGFLFGFLLSSSSDDTLANNTANGNGGNKSSGFFIQVSSSNIISRNTADNNTQYGYFDDFPGPSSGGIGNSYSNNECSGNGVGGSSLSGYCTPQR